MPFGKYADFDECVSDNQDKDNPEGYCSWLHWKITGEWPSEKSIMEGGNMKEKKSQLLKEVNVLKQILIANPDISFKDVQNLIDTWDEWAGSYGACVSALEGKPGIDDPEALCAWLHYEAEGEWPSEKSSKGDVGAIELSGPIIEVCKDKKKRIAYAAVLVPGEKDSDGEIVTKQKVEDACHEWMDLYQNVDYKHTLNNVGKPIENYLTYSERVVKTLDGEELTLPAGTWIIGAKLDEDTFAAVEKGELKGYSIMGIARTALKALKEKDIKLALKSLVDKNELQKALKKTLLRDLGPDWVPASVAVTDSPAVPKSKWFALKSKERKPLSAWDKIKEILSLKSVGKEGKIKEVTKENQIRTINIINKGGKKDMEITKEELETMISTVVKEEIKATKQEEVILPVKELKDVVPQVEAVVVALGEIKVAVTAAETTAGEEVPAVNEKVDAVIEDLKGIVTQVEATVEAGKEEASKESKDAKKVKKEKVEGIEKNEEMEALKGKVDVVTKGLEKIYKALGIVDSKAIKGQDEEEEKEPAKKDFGSRDSFGRKVKKSE